MQIIEPGPASSSCGQTRAAAGVGPLGVTVALNWLLSKFVYLVAKSMFCKHKEYTRALLEVPECHRRNEDTGRAAQC